MTDCPNAEMRDRLPDLLHERLDESARAAVLAHVGECADCSAELALLREMRVSFSSGIVAVDSANVARMVVRRTIAASRSANRRRPWTDWRLAAAGVVLAVGGASIATFYAMRSAEAPVATAVSPLRRASDTARVAQTPGRETQDPASERERRASRPQAELAAAGDVADLSETDLRTLLGDLDTIEAVPPTEPEPVAVRVSLPERGGGGTE